MNAAPLFLLRLAAVALLSGQPSKDPATVHPEADQIAAIIDRPEFRSLIDQLHQAAGTLDLQDEEGQTGYSGRRRTRSHRHEQGLHMGHLTRSDFTQTDGYFSPARGLTPEDEWQQMFPRYALKAAAAR